MQFTLHVMSVASAALLYIVDVILLHCFVLLQGLQTKCTMSQLQELIGDTVIDKSGKSYSISSLYNNATNKPILGLYFSAHWCPPCREFTPVLIQFYQKFQTTSNGLRFQIVFVSSDHDEVAFREYLNEMPWYALPYRDRERKVRIPNNLLELSLAVGFILISVCA